MNATARPFFTEFAARYDLSINEWRVILALKAQPGLSVQEIADVNGYDKMSASRAVRRLIAHGRVARRVDPADRRRALHSLTAEGEAVFLAIAPSAEERVDRLFGTLTAREMAQLDRILAKLEVGVAESWPEAGEAAAQRGGKP